MAAAAWKHDIGSWQSRKSLLFRQQQQQQQQGMQSSTTSVSRDHGGHSDTNHRHSGFLPHRSHRRDGAVTFGPDVWLPSSHFASPAPPPMGSHDDVSLSAMSDFSELRTDTRAFDESVISMRNSMVDDAVEERRISWVTVFGVEPSLILDVRTALERRCGATVTHYWPATGSTCNWFYIEFEKHFDASRAVNLSPVTLDLDGQTQHLTVGVEWCRDTTFVRDRALRNEQQDARRHDVTQTPNTSSILDSSRMSSGTALWTAEGRSFIHEASARAAMTNLTSQRRRNIKYLSAALQGSITIVDAVVGRKRVSFLPALLLNRRQTPEQRLEHLIALSNKKNRHDLPAQWLSSCSATGDSNSSQPSTIIIRSTAAWKLWVNISVFLWLGVLALWWWWRRQIVVFTV
jgi:hypothetical protein